METITSLQNAKVKKWTALHQKKERDQTGLFLVEEHHLISEARSSGCIECIITDEPFIHTSEKEYIVTPQIMRKISENVSAVHQIAVCHKPKQIIREFHRLLLLDDVQDPGNLGTLVRTAASFSFNGVICSKGCADLYNEKTIRSTQGALFHIPVLYADLKEEATALQKKGVQVIATSLEQSASIDEIPVTEQMAFILGNEGQGVHVELQKMADRRLRIDMHGFESLNVAVAGGIIMYSYRNI